MTARRAHLALYRHLTRLYPPAFRHNYRDDLVILFAKQLDDESAALVWGHTFRDLAVSVPTLRLEAHMKRPSSHLLTAVFGIVAGTAALLALMIGTGPATPLFAVVALLTGATALWIWQAGQPVRTANANGKPWWKVLLAGPALAALTFIAMATPWPDAIDLGDNAYWLIVIAFMTSLALATTGLLLGLVTFLERRRTRQVGSSAA